MSDFRARLDKSIAGQYEIERELSGGMSRTYVATERARAQAVIHPAGTSKRLRELHDAKGNTAKALENYEKFVDLRKDADPELQPTVKTVCARIEELKRTGARG